MFPKNSLGLDLRVYRKIYQLYLITIFKLTTHTMLFYTKKTQSWGKKKYWCVRKSVSCICFFHFAMYCDTDLFHGWPHDGYSVREPRHYSLVWLASVIVCLHRVGVLDVLYFMFIIFYYCTRNIIKFLVKQNITMEVVTTR